MTLRALSVLARRLHSVREGRRILRRFFAWQAAMPRPAPARTGRILLIIRLDDIGDYVLFRNQLESYRAAPRWQEHRILLLGNTSWQPLFAQLDAATVDEAVWVDKARYLHDAAYRTLTWNGLRARGIDTVVAPARTRPLLLDDLCMLAAAPRLSIGAANTYVHARWNRASDRLYAELYRAPDPQVHEFHFNGQFAEWCNGTRFAGRRPSIAAPPAPPPCDPYVLCFVGATMRSKRWPVERWIELIRLYRTRDARRVIRVAGASRAEITMAERIAAETGAISLAGRLTLPDLLTWVAGAAAVVTNDTMAAHLSVSCARPTVIIANGVNHERFTDYAPAGMDGIVTVYPEVFERKRARAQGRPVAHHYADAVTADIASISARAILAPLTQLVTEERPAA